MENFEIGKIWFSLGTCNCFVCLFGSAVNS